jgi:hypothetical protein
MNQTPGTHAPNAGASGSSPTGTPAHRDPAALLAAAVCAIVIAGIAYFFSLERQATLNRSQVGFAGLQTWLKSQDIETLTFLGGGALRPEEIGLRILPLFDENLARLSQSPDTEAENLQQKTEYDISSSIVREKMDLVPSLVILPKWRRAVRFKGIAHPAFLIPLNDVQRVRNQIGGIGGSLVRPADGYTENRLTYNGSAFTAGLYQPQFIKGSSCEPLLGDKEAMLLGKCRVDEIDFWILADPDLLNSHGLKLGDNARLGADLIAGLAADGRVIIDLTSRIFVTEKPEQKARSWSDLARFFTYPFSVLWTGFAILCFLFLWHAWVRYGPIVRLFDDRPRASKTNSIDATARLLRLSGHDRRLLQSHFAVRCRMLAADLLGPHRTMGAEPVQELVRIVSQRSPELAREISATSEALHNSTHELSHTELLHLLDQFETLYERTLHEFGRSSEPRPIHQG